jgi:2-polyprenyl-6-methoxyphenol hydroxylase-like FAD-dependent oxidoreductase
MGGTCDRRGRCQVLYDTRMSHFHRVGFNIDQSLQYSDLHEILYDAAVRAGVQVIFDTQVSFAEPPCYPESSGDSLPSCDRPSVHLSDGTILETDMIIGADGQHSTVRLSFQRKVPIPRRTGTIVLSGNVPMRSILEDNVLKNNHIAYSWVYWFGPRRCLMGASSLRDRILRFAHRLLGYPIVRYGKVKFEYKQN